jgi:hypothetical protein
MAHCLVEIQSLTVVPVREHPFRYPTHNVPVALELLGAEGGSHESPLSAPALALAEEQPLAEQGGRQPGILALHEAPAVVRQDGVDVLGIVDHQKSVGPKGEGEEITVLSLQGGEECEGVVPECREQTE